MHQPTTRYTILAPMGAGGNHLRWLMLLDDQFQFQLAPFIPDRAMSETPALKEFLHDPVDLTDVDSKINFINDYVYPQTRSWHNWLLKEWSYRRTLDQHIQFGHQIDDLDSVPVKPLILTMSPDRALHEYFKFNSSLNNIGIEGFLQRIEYTNRINRDIPIDARYLQADELFLPDLDRAFYLDAIQWFGLGDRYPQANLVHQRWYALQQKSQREFVAYFNSLYAN